MTDRTAVREPARAKINLFLHITGRRPDGMHLLDSLVVFAEAGDVVTARRGDELSLTRSGPMAGGLPPITGDLVFRAATLLADAAGIAPAAVIDVKKNLPVASGIGGGSADAAAAIRALTRLWQLDLPPAEILAVARALGADVPVCLDSRSARVGGIGEVLAPAGALPPLHAVLVNPGIAVSTAAVFAAFAAAAPAAPERPEETIAWARAPEELAQQLGAYRNDLTDSAISLCPPIADILAALGAAPDCLLARLSGSGATCFGLFAGLAQAQKAAAALQRVQPDWWVVATALDTGGDDD